MQVRRIASRDKNKIIDDNNIYLIENTPRTSLSTAVTIHVFKRKVIPDLPVLYRLSDWVFLYKTERDGISMKTMYAKTYSFKGKYGLWLDRTSSRSETFDNDSLANEEDFKCVGMEIWGFV
ncbi:hypothetical protein PPL_11898 [Heterostelium album PN500]|uniref:TLDc domain-containing protein n=1 Tax=Heterostelium pallidum (strain ATCC 26659 / Pp 5 / PN500) TaxID=670386 RepID=D3BUS6_HETP5|nr:hypothetical protein PPL_11898 [Heterostelium album PN500]EFA74864.1 hypothetical protein PPL_11898 [Heterostelium album PN500]|eukprot:XP_020426998.1 hypothetical protein PPL_11898 [Heterostelium album PN500]